MNDLVFDVTIVGGGFAGSVAAALLADAGYSVALLEARLNKRERGLRGELLHPGAVAALETLGLGDALREAGAARIPGIAAYECPQSAPAILPYPVGAGIGLEHERIVGCIRQALASRPGIRVFEANAQSLVRESAAVVGVQCADGRVFRSPLLVAADGRHSRLRGALGLRAARTLLSYALGATIDGALLPVEGHGHVFVGGPGPVLVYPISHGAARVNVDVPLDAPRDRSLLLRYVAEQYAPHVPSQLFDAILRALSEQPPLGASNHAVLTLSCATRGAVLLGDSGGCSHPLTATGMTSAVHDAVTLTAALSEHGLRPGSEDALLAYQQRRYQYVRAREAFAQALFEVFRGRDAGDRSLRDAVFRYWESPRARRRSMEILVGEESRTRVFAAEYARVAVLSAMLGTHALVRERSLTRPAAALSGVMEAARTGSQIILDRVMTAARARSLDAPPRWVERITSARGGVLHL